MKIRKFLIIFAMTALLSAAASAEPVWGEMTQTGSLPLQYATEFSADYFDDIYTLISVTDGGRYLVIPEGADMPRQLDADITVLQQPVKDIYLVATSAMDLYRALGAVDRIRFSCLQESGWYVEEARQAMADGSMQYAGKYNTPDYELLCSGGCGMALESTMVYHVPEVKEMLELLEIPVVVERSSRETNPLGRMEWMKFHALILGCLEEAEEKFEAETAKLQPVLEQEKTGKTVALFALNDDGSVIVRKSNDYIVRTIQLAGGEYVFQNLGEEDSSQTTIAVSLETFYAAARNADVLICSSAMNGEYITRKELLDKWDLLGDFRAFETGNVWSTGANLFQSTMGLGDFLLEIHSILTEPTYENLQYLNYVQ